MLTLNKFDECKLKNFDCVSDANFLTLFLFFSNLNDNHLGEIEKKAFEEVQVLKSLNLSNNPLRTLTPGSFEGLSVRAVMTLPGSKYLTVLPAETFRGGEINDLKLQNSGLKIIEKGAFKNLMIRNTL